MHRLTNTGLCSLFLALACTLPACGEKKAPADPSSKAKDNTDVGFVAGANADKAEGSEGGGAAEKPRAATSSCIASDSANLEDLLARSDCEVPNAKPDAIPNADVKGKLDVTLTASPTKVKPGGKVDLLVTFTNKSKEPMPLHFRLDPLGRFETEVYDAKAKRADMPAGQPPPAPKGHTAPPPADQKVGKVIVAVNGNIRVRVPWDAVKMKWAPEKVRGTAVEKGFPRGPAGPLPKGKYNVKVVTPLIGVFEGSDHEVSTPHVEVEVGG